MLKVMVPAGAAVMLAALAATNPDQTAHTRALVDHAKQSCGSNLLVKEVCGGFAGLAGLGLSYDDHLFYSTAHVGEIETVGVLGRVMVVSE